MVVSMALLVAPVMQHRLVERGESTPRLLRTTTRFAAMSLLPLALSLAAATYVVMGRRYGTGAGILSGLCMGTTCALFWFGIEVFVGISKGAGEMKENSTPLKTKVEQLLTEARVINPGEPRKIACSAQVSGQGFRQKARTWICSGTLAGSYPGYVRPSTAFTLEV